MQEILINVTSFLDEDAQSYLGKQCIHIFVQVKFNLTFPYPTQFRIQIISWISALQSRLEWESGYVAQRTPLSPVSIGNIKKVLLSEENCPIPIHLFTYDKFHLSEVPSIPEAVVEAVAANTKVCQLLQSPQFPSFDSSAVVRFPNPLANGSDIHGSCWGTWLLFLFSCRGSYLGSPCLSSLGWSSPAYLRGFLFSCRPFCLWFWSFHNVGCFQWITSISNRSPQRLSNSHNFLHLPPVL